MEELSRENCHFPLMELPVLVREKIITFVTDPYDLKALRRTCSEIQSFIDKTPELLVHFKVVPKDLDNLETLVNNESNIKWNNFRFPPKLYYVGSRRYYVERFNQLFSSFAEQYAMQLQFLEMDRFDFSNVHHIALLSKCQMLVSFKVDVMKVKGIPEQNLKEVLDNEGIVSTLAGLKHLDVTVFEFLVHDYQFDFMGRLLQKCTNLCTMGSWGYFPEWEHPVGGPVHFKHFVWPLLQYLRKREEILDLMLENVETSDDLADRDLPYLNESMDWQSGKWILDLTKRSDTYSSLEDLVYSKIKCYSHRAVGWFDENEFLKSGLPLMKNLSTIYIHHTRDIRLREERPLGPTVLFPKLENVTLIVGNRLGKQIENSENDVRLEQVVVEVLLSVCRPSVKKLCLDIDLDHQHENGSIQLPLVIKNFPNLTYFSIEEWSPTDQDMLAVYSAFSSLQTLMFCGRNLTDYGILGKKVDDDDGDVKGIRSLKYLLELKIFSIRVPPKNIFPWLIKENDRITDFSFQLAFSRMKLRRFHFLLNSEKITRDGVQSLLEGEFAKANIDFSMNTLPKGVASSSDFEKMHPTFKYVDARNTFLEPSNFVIPDIGKWVL